MNSEKLAVIMLGAPGSGKGTQGRILEEKTGFKRYVMSDVIRNFVEEGSDIYNKMKSGILLSDLDIFEVFRKGFNFEDKIIIDGIPRSVDQAYWLYGFLKSHDYEMRVVYFSVDEEALLNRILKRAKDEGREDDNEEVFKERMRQYDEAKDVVLDVFSDNIIDINGDRGVEEISEDVLSKLGI